MGDEELFPMNPEYEDTGVPGTDGPVGSAGYQPGTMTSAPPTKYRIGENEVSPMTYAAMELDDAIIESVRMIKNLMHRDPAQLDHFATNTLTMVKVKKALLELSYSESVISFPDEDDIPGQ